MYKINGYRINNKRNIFQVLYKYMHTYESRDITIVRAIFEFMNRITYLHVAQLRQLFNRPTT